MDRWSLFYGTLGTAAAALLGLLFVVVSINAGSALGPSAGASRRLADQAFQNYIAVMMVSYLALFPEIHTTTFGGVTLASTGMWGAWVLIHFVAQAMRDDAWQMKELWVLRRHLSSVIGFTILLTSALCFALDLALPYSWLAAAMLILMFSATSVSWDLLRQIANRGGDAGS
ncbi:MAG: hypothetical protein P4L98_17220 [Ancalomicrobiaceae bacterium]|nr:hypothetical protein [Ancalomicrobiaceae bacterium]